DVAFDTGDLFRHAVEGGIAFDGIEGERRTIDAEHFAGAERCGLDAPAADVAEQIKHPLALDVGRQPRAVQTVIVDPAALLALYHRGLKLYAVLFQVEPFRYHTEGGVHVAFQAVGITGSGVVLPQHAAWLEHLYQGFEEGVLAALLGCRRDLYHQVVVEAVYDQAG